MRKKILSVILSLSLVCANIALPIINDKEAAKKNVSAAETDKWSLVWSDEFEGNSLNRNNWNVEVNGYGGWNNELQYYCDSPENIQVSDGTLKLIAIKKQYEGKEYTSARINTQNKVTVHHGRIEARIKLPCFTGAFPAFWMMGANGQRWPACGEIDIMEAINDESIIYGTAHWQASYANNEDKYDSNGSSTYEAGVRVDTTQWHTYGIEWTEDKIVWFVDDSYYHSVDIKSEKEMEELAIPCYFLLNFAVGGDWPGFNVNENALPATMEVDYVRAYEVNDNYVEPPTIVVEEDIVATHTGSWITNVGTWGNGSGTMTSTQNPREGFNANLTAIGSDMWAIYGRLDNLKYTAGNTYTFKSTFTSNINKNVFVKVEGDNQSALAETYLSLKAGVPYTYETTVFIPNTYTGGLSLYYAVGGVMNGETLAATTPANITVNNVSFSARTTMIDPGYENPTTETVTEEITTTEVVTEAPTIDDGYSKGNVNEWASSGNWGVYYGNWDGTADVSYKWTSDSDYQLYFNQANKGKEWLVQARYDNPAISGHTYKVTVDVTADKSGSVGIKEDLSNNANAQEYTDIQAGDTVQLSGIYTVTGDTIRVMFELGKGIDTGTTVRFTNIYIEDITEIESPTEEETTTVNIVEKPELSINGYQISATAEGFRTIYTVNDTENQVVSSGLVYGLYDISESDLVVGSANDTVYYFESTEAGKITFKLDNVTGDSYAMTMKFINNIDFFKSNFNVRAYAKLSDGSYIYSDVVKCTVYDLADKLYKKQLMTNLYGHNYLYNSILYFVNKEYAKIEFDMNNTLYPY